MMVSELVKYGFEPSHKSRDGRTEIYNFRGIDWFDAPIPWRFHICHAWTIGYDNWFTLVERCACGGRRIGGSRWWNKNERRRS